MKAIRQHFTAVALLAAAAGSVHAASPGVGASAAPAAVAAHSAEASAPALFAVVDGQTISAAEYQSAVTAGLRQKFYHGRPPEDQVSAYRREVAQELIDRVLLRNEAKRRDIQADHKKVREALDGYESRYAKSPQWQQMRANVLPPLQQHLEQRSVLEQLEQNVKNVAEPDEQQVKEYYAGHQQLFTQPEQIRVSLILLKVDPSSPRAAWDQAREEGAALMKKLKAGADFGDLAKIHSAAPSGADGGDMGTLHRGRLPQALHEEIDKLQPGMISEPLTTLEGVAIFRLDERQAPRVSPFERARTRAADLWKREKANSEWEALLARLRRAAVITIDTERFPELTSLDPVRRAAAAR